MAQRCGEPARLAPVQKHERERGIFVRLHHKIPGMRIGVENGFGKSGKQRIEPASELEGLNPRCPFQPRFPPLFVAYLTCPSFLFTTDELSLENKAPDPSNSATSGYSLTAFSVPLLPLPQIDETPGSSKLESYP